MKNLKILDESIIKPYQNQHRMRPVVAIVGNAGVSPLDNELIQDSDCVIRFNNYATRAGIQHTEVVNQCDILFTTFDLHSHTAKPKDVVIGIPFPFKPKEIIIKAERWYQKSQLWMVNPYTNLQMLLDLKVKDSLGFKHPFPSIGTTALWHLKDWDADFYVMGFGWYYDPNTRRFQNWDLRNKNYPTTWNHNYPVEVEWALRTLMPKDNFIFSVDCTNILNEAKRQLRL